MEKMLVWCAQVTPLCVSVSMVLGNMEESFSPLMEGLL